MLSAPLSLVVSGICLNLKPKFIFTFRSLVSKDEAKNLEGCKLV